MKSKFYGCFSAILVICIMGLAAATPAVVSGEIGYYAGVAGICWSAANGDWVSLGLSGAGLAVGVAAAVACPPAGAVACAAFL